MEDDDPPPPEGPPPDLDTLAQERHQRNSPFLSRSSGATRGEDHIDPHNTLAGAEFDNDGSTTAAFDAVAPNSTFRRRPRSMATWEVPRDQPVTDALADVRGPGWRLRNAVRYRLRMKPDPGPLLPGDACALEDGLYEYLRSKGHHRSADLLLAALAARQSQHCGGAAAKGLQPPVRRAPLPVSLQAWVDDVAAETSGLYDDETVWSSAVFFENADLSMDSIAYKGQNYPAATLDRILEKLILEEATAEDNGPIDPQHVTITFTTTFLATSVLFATPDVLLSRLFKLFKSLSLHSKLIGPERVAQLQSRILDTLRWFAETHRAFVTRVVFERAVSFAVSVLHGAATSTPQSVLRAATTLLDDLKRHPYVDAPEQRPSRFPYFYNQHPRPALPTAVPQVHCKLHSVLDWTPEVLADQLCLANYDCFSKINFTELYDGAFADPNLRQAAAPNLRGLLEHREQFVLWVATSIVAPTELAQRQASFARWVRVGQRAFDRRNYFGAEAVLVGLEHSAVRRLSHTAAHSKLEPEDVETISALQTAFNPFTGTVKGLPFNLDGPALPVLGFMLNELHRTHENAATRFPRGEGDRDHEQQEEDRINWGKMLVFGKHALRCLSYQAWPYTGIEPDPAVLRVLSELTPRFDEEHLYEMAGERLRSHGG